jgi:hypothetical protein
MSRKVVSACGEPKSFGGFQLSVDQFDMLHYAGMAIFKIGIILLNLVPYIACASVQEACGHNFTDCLSGWLRLVIIQMRSSAALCFSNQPDPFRAFVSLSLNPVESFHQ